MIKKVLFGITVLSGLLLVACSISPQPQSPRSGQNSTVGGSGSATSSPSAAASPSAVPATSTAPAVTRTRTVTRVLFVVTGTAAQGADITYGSDSDNRSPHGGLGPLGSGTAIPWHGSIHYHKSALYYYVSAQLQGSGNITCKVRVQVTAYYSDGTHRTRAKTTATGHASGEYNICDAQSD